MFSSPGAATNSRIAPRTSLRADRSTRRPSRSARPSSRSSSARNDSSLAASRRRAISSSQPPREANSATNARSFDNPAASSATASRPGRGAVASRTRVIRMATRPPTVMPFCSKPPARVESCSGNITPAWQPTPTPNATPAISTLRWSIPPCTTSVMPRTRLRASSTVTKATATGAGMARSRASALGRNARPSITAPAAIPTRRAPTPVSSTAGILTALVWVGMVPAMPASRLATPSAATAPCTARESTARGRRHDTRWMATAAVTVWTAPMRATNRKAGRSPTNAGPSSDSMPGHATGGRPTHGAAATRSGS